MQNTPPLLPFVQRSTDELIEDLCLALRDVGVWTYSLPKDERAISNIKRVQEIYALLEGRDTDIRHRIEQLSEETSWQMEALLQESIAFPNVIPYVRDIDGIRRALRCYMCQKNEFPDREGIGLCDVCLMQAKESVENRVAMKGMILLRLYTEQYWCKHANSETVLIAFDDNETLNSVYCNECLSEEQFRRTNENSQS